MRLFVDAHAFDGGISQGVTTYMEGLYKELVKTASDIDFYFAAQDTMRLESIFGTRENVHYVKYGSKNKYRRLAFEIPRIVRRLGIDAAHFQYTSPLVKRCKEIVTIHDVLFLDYPQYFPASYYHSKKWLFGRSARRADLLLTVSEYSKERLERFYRPRKPVRITPNAVDKRYGLVRRSEAEALLDGRVGKYILYVSRVEPRKNHLLLLRAYVEGRFYERGYALVFIGKTSIAVPELHRYCEKLPEDIRQNVFFFEQKPFEELLAWYKCASLFVYPSIAEGFGIPPLEAAVAGVPCICSNRTAMQDFRFFGEGTYDPEDLDQTIEKIELGLSPAFRDPERLERIRQAVERRYDWASIAKEYYAYLTDL